MKKTLFLFGLFVVSLAVSAKDNQDKPRVFIFTDINIDAGDPDDRQSLIHLFWYADELRIEGIVPDRWSAEGYEACMQALDAYSRDYRADDFDKKGFPQPDQIRKRIATDMDHATKLFKKAASEEDDPLYVLIWGNMVNFGKILRQYPGLHENIRLITIGTHLMMEAHREHIPPGWEKTEKPCKQFNWNGHGRNEIYNEPAFKDMWWLEINWTYEGMFPGEEPREMFRKLAGYGALGQHIKEVVKNKSWAQYFRVGDTPSVLYVIDPDHDLDDPGQESWAGKFKKPFPEEGPNYYTDHNGPVEWNYANPCDTWENHVEMAAYAKGTLLDQRPEMYAALLEKLDRIYDR